MLFNVLWLFVVLAAGYRILARIVGGFSGTACFGFLRTPLARERRPYLYQASLRTAFWAAAGLTIHTALIPAQFTGEEFAALQFLFWGALLTVAASELIPPYRISYAMNALCAAAVLFLSSELVCVYRGHSAQEAVELTLPFEGEWLVVQGGASSLVNHHFPILAQRHALDLVRLVKKQEREGDRKKLASFYSWSQPVLAPAEGTVVRAVSTLADLAIGKADPQNLAGNHLVIEMQPGRYILLAHLQHESLTVKTGDRVKAGQVVARCGNSGNTSAPHLHLQVQSDPELSAAGTRTFPIVFRDAQCLRGGTLRPAANLRRNDVLRASPSTR
jgi:hypothetical protein